MNDLRNTIAHILGHKQRLTEANDATTQQYVILPILRALGWDDANLASMEVLPEYTVENRRADYALYVKHEQNPMVLIECKRWDLPIGRHEEQICFYAYSGNIPFAIITNGKRWRFYLSRWEASSLSDSIFCETDIENREDAISDLEKYLLKSNVASEETELNAQIALEEKEEVDEKEKVDQFKPDPISSRTDWANDRSKETKSKRKIKWTFPISPTELRRARVDAGVLTKTISDACGYAHNVDPSMWENGHRNVPPKHHRTVWGLIFPSKPFPSS